MAAKRPTGAYPKSSKKANAKRVFEAGVKSGKVKSVEAGMTGAMVAKAAGKVISKVVSKKTASALPSKIVNKKTSYKVQQTASGKIKLITESGNTVTFPKGTTAQQIATKMQEGKTLFGPKSITDSMRGKTGRIK
jgi:hypothetical protein